MVMAKHSLEKQLGQITNKTKEQTIRTREAYREQLRKIT